MNANIFSRKIEMTKAEAEAAGKIGSEKFGELQQYMKEFPGFEIQIKASVKRKVDLKGLDYDYMRNYILTHEDDKNALIVLAEFSEMRQISRCHSQAKRYPVIKNWFLEKYPEIKNFGETVSVSEEDEFAEAV